MNVLFLCTGNSCRSILAEATFNHLAPPGWQAMSAGSHPAGQVNPRALAVLAREGIPSQGPHSKSWEKLPLTPGTAAAVDAAYSTSYRILRGRIEAFVALPLSELQTDPRSLKAELDRIGATSS